MRYVEDKVQGLRIAYIGGGSKGWAWGLMSDLASEAKLSGTVALYDIDIRAAQANEIIGNKYNELEGALGKWDYVVAESLKEALTGADFVIVSILPATFEEMRSDVHEPEKYGIYQSVGDTVGPGGLFRALRTIPMYVTIAEAIRDFAPNAWVINYTNPMSLCVRTLYQVFPKVKAFGCCHEVFGTQALIGNAIEQMEGIEKPTRDEIKINVKGINHFTWIDRVTYKGMDVMPIYKRFVEQNYQDGFGAKDDNWMNNSFDSRQRVKFDLFKRYGVIAAAGDRHLAEFCPGSWYLKDPDTVHSWKFNLTTVDWRIKSLEKKLEQSKNLVSGKEKVELKKTGEEGVHQMKALLGLGDIVTNVNVPNIGQVEGLPYGSVVETNALFQKDRVTPITAGALPLPVHALVSRHVFNQETILKAALEKDTDMAFAAFVNDPLVTCKLDEAKELFKAMVDNTKKYLDGIEIK